MWVDAVRDEALPIVVEIDAPGVRRAVGEVLEFQARRMDAIDAAIAVNAMIRRSGPGNVGWAGAPVAAVQPAVRTPGEAVDEVVPALLIAEPIEQDVRLAVRLVIAIAVAEEIEMRRRHDPDPAKANLDAGDVAQPFVEDLTRISAAIAIRVFEDDDAILTGRLPGAIVERLGNPQPAAIVDAERDRLHDVRFRREEGRTEAIGQHHGASGLLGVKRPGGALLREQQHRCGKAQDRQPLPHNGLPIGSRTMTCLSSCRTRASKPTP